MLRTWHTTLRAALLLAIVVLLVAVLIVAKCVIAPFTMFGTSGEPAYWFKINLSGRRGGPLR
jgi:hypothetical protein